MLDAGDPQDLVGLTVWFVPPPETIRSGTVVSVRQGPKGPLLTVAGVDDIDMARALAGRQVVLSPQDVPPGLVSAPTLTGIQVYDEVRGRLGSIQDVIHTGANDVWVVRGGPFGEVLIPEIDEVVIDIDEEERRASVRLLPGLLDEE